MDKYLIGQISRDRLTIMLTSDSSLVKLSNDVFPDDWRRGTDFYHKRKSILRKGTKGCVGIVGAIKTLLIATIHGSTKR